MPIYVMLSTLGPQGSQTLREQPDRLKQVNTEVEALGVKVLQQYALLGRYDFLNILEAPDEVTMAKKKSARKPAKRVPLVRTRPRAPRPPIAPGRPR